MKNKLNFFAWILTGLVLAASITAMFAAGKVNLDKFYDVGKINDVYTAYLEVQQQDARYKDTTNWDFLCVTSDDARIRYDLYTSKWNYMLLDMSYGNAEDMTVSFFFYNSKNRVVGSRRVVLTEGENVIEVCKDKFQYIVMQVKDQSGKEYRMNKMQFRMTLPFRTTGQLFVAFAIVFIGYGILSYTIYHIMKRKKWTWNLHIADKLPDGYVKVLSSNVAVFSRIPGKVRHCIRIVSFMAWFLYMVNSFNTGSLASGYQQNCMVSILLLIVLSVCSIERENKGRQWDRSYVNWSFVLILWMCISDFVVSKRCGYMGYIFLIFFGLFFASLRYSIRKWDVLDDLVTAMHILFVGTTIFCIICRPITTRYLGFYINTNVYATYLVTMFVICMFELYRAVLGQGKRRRVVAVTLESCCILYLWWLTQARGALLALLSIVVICLFGWIKQPKSREGILRIGLFIITFCIIAIPLTELLGYVLENVPYRLGTVWQFKNDTQQFVEPAVAGRWFVTDAYASMSRIKTTMSLGRSLDSISSGRITFWKAYLYQMNLMGHYFRAKISGEVHYAHNMFIVMMYRYGVPVLIPFAMYWLTTLKRSIVLFKKSHSEYGMVVLGLLATYFILAQLDVLEQPWAYPGWLLAYMMPGWLLAENNS